MANRYALTLASRQSVMSVASHFMSAVKGYAPQHWWGANQNMAPWNATDANANYFGFRQPVRVPGGAGYWYYSETGDAVEEQDKVDEQINMLADCGIKAISALYFGREADFQTSNQGIPAQVRLWLWFDRYMTSSVKSRLKFSVMPVTPNVSFDTTSGPQPDYPVAAGTWLNLPAEAAYWAALAQDAQALKDKDGNTILYLFDGTGTAWTASQKTTINTAFTNAGLSAPTYVVINKTAADTDAFGAQYTTYGPAGDGLGGTQNSYRAQITRNRDNWVAFSPAGAKFQAAITALADAQPLHGVGGIPWADRATYSECEEHIAQTMAYVRSAYNHVPDKAITIYSIGELSEGGDWFPTRQSILRGVNTPSRGTWMDAWKNVVNGTRPSAYVDCYHATSKHADITRTGAGWSLVFGVHNGGGSNIAPFDFREALNTTADDTLTITPAKNCTRIRIYGDLGPAYTFNAQTDGGGATLVDQTAGATSYNNLLYDTGVLSAGSHNVKLTVVTGCRIDEIKVNISR